MNTIKKKRFRRYKKITERNKKFIEQNNLLKKQEQDELTKLLVKQRDELNKLLENNRNKQEEEDIDWDKINEIRRKANELNENINSRSSTNLRTFTLRSNPFDDINKNKEKLTPPVSKIPAPIPKSREPQGVAVGEQAGVEIMKNEFRLYWIFKKRIRQYRIFIEKSFRN